VYAGGGGFSARTSGAAFGSNSEYFGGTRSESVLQRRDSRLMSTRPSSVACQRGALGTCLQAWDSLVACAEFSSACLAFIAP
jgi:hypothetical protein